MPSAVEHAQQFLAARGLSLEDVANCVGEIPDSSTVIFSGSVCEGLANDYSDLDLLMLGDGYLAHDPAGLPLLQAGDAAIAFQPDLGSLRVQIEHVRTDHLAQLAGQMKETAESFHNPEHSERVFWFGELDTRTFHRVGTGICLRNPDVAAEWKARLLCDFFPSYMLATMAAQHSNLLEDAVGEARAGRHESALWALSYAVGFAAGALLASSGATNPNAKWWVRLLQLNRERAGVELADALVNQMTTPPPVVDFDQHFDSVRSLCERTITTAVSRDAVVQARRRKMLARARDVGVALPGSRRS